MLFFAVLLLAASASSQPSNGLKQGVEALGRKDYAEATRSLEQARKAAPEDASVHVLLAQAYAGAGSLDKARAAAQKAERLSAGDPQVAHGLAYFYAQALSEHAKAAGLEAQYAASAPDDKSAWPRVAALYLRAGLAAEALPAAQKAFRSDETEENRRLLEDAYFRIAKAHLNAREFKQALVVLTAAEKLLPASAQIQLALGVAGYGLRDFSASVDRFLRTIDLAPDVLQPYLFLSRILDHTGDRLPTVVEKVRGYRERHPDDHFGHFLLAKALYEQSPRTATAEIIGLLEEALQRKEDDGEAHYLLGTVLAEQEEFQRAAAHLERSVALSPKNPLPHYRLARVYLKLGRKEDALRERDLHQRLSEQQQSGVPTP